MNSNEIRKEETGPNQYTLLHRNVSERPTKKRQTIHSKSTAWLHKIGGRGMLLVLLYHTKMQLSYLRKIQKTE